MKLEKCHLYNLLSYNSKFNDQWSVDFDDTILEELVDFYDSVLMG
jgi:hypothetical protein